MIKATIAFLVANVAVAVAQNRLSDLNFGILAEFVEGLSQKNVQLHNVPYNGVGIVLRDDSNVYESLLSNFKDAEVWRSSLQIPKGWNVQLPLLPFR